jgi:hypothetical protein
MTVAEQHEAIDANRRFSFEGDGGVVGHHKKSDPTDKDKCMKLKINYGWNLKFNLYMESKIYRWIIKSKFIKIKANQIKIQIFLNLIFFFIIKGLKRKRK